MEFLFSECVHVKLTERERERGNLVLGERKTRDQMSGGVLNAVRLGGSPTLQSLTASFSYFSSHNCDYYYVFLTEIHGYNPSPFIALPLLPTAIFSSWVWDPVVAINKKWNTCV